MENKRKSHIFENKKLIIFDLDGTLLNTIEDLKDAVNYALKTYGYPLRDLDYIRTSIGNGVSVLIKRCLPPNVNDEIHDQVLNVFRKYYLSHYKDKTTPYDNIILVCNELKERGYKLAVATNKLHSAAVELIKTFFNNTFDYIQGDDKKVLLKPNKDMINAICKSLNISIKDSLYIGDTNVDYETVKNSSIDFIMVNYGYRKYNELTNDNKKVPQAKEPLDILNYLI